MVRTARFAFDEGLPPEERGWFREEDDLGDEFDGPIPGAAAPEGAALDAPGESSEAMGEGGAIGECDHDLGDVARAAPRRHLADADWLRRVSRGRPSRRAG